MTNEKVTAFAVGVCMCIAVAMICMCFIKPQDESVFKAGVREGCAMTIYCANNGMTNIPIDKVVDEAWAIWRARK